MIDAALQQRVTDLYHRYAETLCDRRIDAWPDFFTEDCNYRMVSRPNHERGMRIGPMFSESKGALKDRVLAINETLVHAARSLTHIVSGTRVVSQDGGQVHARSMVAVYQTLVDGITQLQLVARTFDVIDARDGELKFKERVVVFDTELLAGAVVYPV